ncbi:MAG: hypothetical protein A2Y45_04045 [Tenericutes bacterium GWC2_34_14]|nr:MAG: hypothetical protein A2Z84_05640 [Tenericutes bacterium GWA2_35_7]OHE28776.1 MAG: hypothetical protein A2Y45_04045 [Tenericutes bacterium GWC2_34_14]OHE33244.1 MAG: hypothetical protein A2012_05825 [Tenericutes bacterium GWE2_34_108]OHE36394.1 MAG: hypothetical protein A2Y46_07930 [Tenericutes bacterium GWF1_35_14]OHE37598.1 MAG: hypothetical protein A2Y44_02855 [Tenericutes bacterium GWF2_35_184]OHE45125.1 MAG: hypothetical protein A2221_02655 [Tenericutes bacterium RIFOXYA2_FULL_36_3
MSMKIYQMNENKDIINHFNSETPVEIPEVYHEKEVRAFWVSNVVNIDLPTVEDIDLFQKKVISILDTAVDFNINTLYFQVRTTNDAFYESKLNPYSRYFTGVEGKKPPFDVLAWIIKEAKQRGLSFHAWCNPYRVSLNGTIPKDEYLKTCDDLNFAKKHPELIVLDKKGAMILNPAKDEVKQFITDSMVELVSNYDVDGIHFDDYFYPYAGLDDVYNDLKEYEFREEESWSLGDFRRHHVTDAMRKVYQALKKHNPKLQFGLSPFGIWKTKESDPKGANVDPRCSESYYGQYADSVTWVKEGIVDYIVPQIYWDFGHHLAPFADLLDWWVDLCKDTNVKLYIGHGAYRLGTDSRYQNPNEIVDQVKYANQHDVVSGNVFFTAKTFMDQDKAFPGMQNLKKLFKKEV